jgi:membrane associated rhomboid family serine protease
MNEVTLFGVTHPIIRSTGRSLKVQVATLGGSLATPWGVTAANVVVGGSLLQYGIHPRTVQGLWGIFAAPLLHANLQHLIANSVPLIIFGWLVMLRDRRHFWPVTVIATLGAGLLAWTLGAPNSVHIGASGVVFGYLGFLLLAGWFTRSVGSILLSLGVGVVWGGLVFGVMPGQPGISWQAHLGGFIGGVLAAKWLAPRRIR